MKKITSPPQILYFLSLLFFWLDKLLKNSFPPPIQFFQIFIPLFKKGRTLETMFMHLKIYNVIIVSFCVFVLEHFDVFKMFLLLLAMFHVVFCIKTFPHFYDQIKHRVGSKFYPPTKNNKHMQTIETK